MSGVINSRPSARQHSVILTGSLRPETDTKEERGSLRTPLFGLAWRRNLIVAAFILIDAEAIFFAERGIVVLADCTDLDLDRSIVGE